jgi:gliding motility-associated-like protein
VQQNSTGKFTISNVNADTILYITRQYGSCTSSPGIVNLKVVDESYFAIPTAFTPNGDGRNDRLRVKVIGYVELKYFRIFNRYGQLIYETHQLNDGWNGTVNGQLQDTGSFVWVAEGKDVRGNPITAKGSFVLIR